MQRKVSMAFRKRGLTLSTSRILPTRKLKPGVKATVKYKRIAASVHEIGIIEPLIVYPAKGRNGNYILLDGHVRFEILKDSGTEQAFCLVATDDEAFTYNHKVNQLSPIQEHFMVRRAIENGVPEERIAAALDLDVALIRQKRDLLKGICPEAVELLKEKRASPGALREFRKVVAMRQIEMAELMIASNNFAASYAKCLIAATPQDQFVERDKPKAVGGLTPDDMARIESETKSLAQDFRRIEESHGRNVLNLVVAVGYLKKLLDNARVVRYFSQHCPDILAEFQKIIEATALEKDA